MNSVKCIHCGLINWATAGECKRCGKSPVGDAAPQSQSQQSDYSQQQQSAPYAQPSTSYASYGASFVKQRKGLAVASLVVGILSLLTFGGLGIGALLGIIFGVVALSKIKKRPMEYGGRSAAVAGIVISMTSVVLLFFVGIVASIAIPNLLASMKAANEGSAIQYSRLIAEAEVAYFNNSPTGQFGTLEQLAAARLIDPTLIKGVKNGYKFEVSAEGDSFAVRATPVEYRKTGNRSFYVSNDGVIHAADKHGLKGESFDPVLAQSRMSGNPAMSSQGAEEIAPQTRPVSARQE